MATLKHVELLDRSSLAAGVQRLAIIRDVKAATYVRKVGAERRLTVAIPTTIGKYASMVPARWLRLEFTDGTWHEWRILEMGDASEGGDAAITCGGYSAALAKCPEISTTDTDGVTSYRFDGVALTVAQHLSTYILPAITAGGLSFVVAGTINPTGLFDITYDGDNPWAALQKLAEASGTELDIERVGSEVRLHFYTQTGSGTAGGTLRVGDNATLKRVRSCVEQQTRLVGLGADSITIGEAVWKITAIASLVLTLADPAGGDGPILRDDQLNGLYAEAKNRTTRTAITDSALSGQTITVASATGFAVGDLIRIRKDSAGARVTYLEDPVQVATFGVLTGDPLRLPDIPETCNILSNPTQSIWTGASSVPADGWAAVGSPTITRTTTSTYVRTGGYSARIQSAANGAGYATPLMNIAPTKDRPFVSGFVSFYLVSGRVRIELVLTNGSQTWIVPDGIDPSRKAVTTTTGVFIQAGVAGIDAFKLGATQARLRIVQEGSGTAEFYVDAGQLTESAGQLPFVDGSGPTKLWQAVNRQLALVAPTRVRYDANALDFYRLDAARYPYRQFRTGATHRLHDPVLGIVDGVRVLEIEEDVISEAVTRLVLSNRPEDLASLFDRDPAARLSGNVINAPVLAAVRTVADGTTSGSVTLGSASAGFTTSDIGKTAWIFGAGPGGAILKTRITAYTSATAVSVADAVSAYVSAATVIIGSADEVATVGASIGGTRAGSALLNEDGTLADGVSDVNGREAKRFYAKTADTDPDTFDAIVPGSTYLPQIPLLTISITQNAIAATYVDVNVAASDPTGGAAPTIAGDPSGSVTSLGGGVYRLARATSGSGPVVVEFTATKTGRETARGSVTVPEQAATAGTVPPSIDFLVNTGRSTGSNYLTLEWGVSNEPASETYDLRYRWKTMLAGGTITGEGNGTDAGISTAYNWTHADLDIVDKGDSGWEYLEVSFQLRMKNSGGTIVATIDALVTDYAIYTP